MGVQTNKNLIRCILPFLLMFFSPVKADEIVHHEIRVQLEPAEKRLQVVDSIRLPQGIPPEFLLHTGLKPRSLTQGVRIVETGRLDGAVPLVSYRVSLPDNRRDFRLEYGGQIDHDFTTLKESPGRQRQRLSGTISEQGIYLDGATGWYPRFPETLQHFSLEIDLPDGWLAVSQGQGPDIKPTKARQRISWSTRHPQDDIYLIAAKYQLYRQPMGGLEAQVFLRQADAKLAQRYLDATEHYIETYQALIGPYPYAKFALVENFWETGYGMPSFTLLGPRVIRLPFILHSSYPHEILHNWWGNGVFVDYAQGNWSEGLTTYLADHLIAEQRGKGVEYRRSALKRYGDFVGQESDFPLSDFRSRHTTASQAVGYDKSLMLFHMLRRKLGDEAFTQGLKNFYSRHQFQIAGYPELQNAFAAVSQAALDDFFRQWTQRTGAPSIAIGKIALEQIGERYRLKGRLQQTQKAPVFNLDVPVAIQFHNHDPQIESLRMTQREHSFELDLPAKPVRVTVDPWFDLFRRLDREETPPSLSQLFSADRLVIVLSAADSKEMGDAYRRLAERWAKDFPKASILTDKDIGQLPNDSPILLLGWDNRFLTDFFQRLPEGLFSHSPDGITLAGESFDRSTHSFALVQQMANSQQPMIWIASHSTEAVPGLSRKLPHYGKYGALAFAGPAPTNRLKLQWPVTENPLSIMLEGSSAPAPLTQPPPLISRRAGR
jgi:hypothetical protein